MNFTRTKVGIAAILLAITGFTTAATAYATAPSAATEAVSTGEVFHRTELYFGRKSPRGEISEEEFAHFVDVEVTKRFPDGLTLLDGLGQFQDSGTVIKEKSKVLILLYPFNDRTANREIEEIRQAYKDQFQQTSVLRVDDLQKVSF